MNTNIRDLILTYYFIILMLRGIWIFFNTFENNLNFVIYLRKIKNLMRSTYRTSLTVALNLIALKTTYCIVVITCSFNF